MLIYIIRHGETKANAEGYLQGWSNDALNANGIMLAEITGKRMNGIVFDEAFTSPLERAYGTAEIILKESGNINTKLYVDERIKEINMGDWERKKFKALENEIDIDDVNQFFGKPDMNVAFPGGESLKQVAKRTQEFLLELVQRNDDKTYLVSTHGCALRCMLNVLYEDPSDYWQGHVPYNCAVSVVSAKDGEVSLIEDDKIYYDKEQIIDRYKI